MDARGRVCNLTWFSLTADAKAQVLHTLQHLLRLKAASASGMCTFSPGWDVFSYAACLLVVSTSEIISVNLATFWFGSRDFSADLQRRRDCRAFLMQQLF